MAAYFTEFYSEKDNIEILIATPSISMSNKENVI